MAADKAALEVVAVDVVVLVAAVAAAEDRISDQMDPAAEAAPRGGAGRWPDVPTGSALTRR